MPRAAGSRALADDLVRVARSAAEIDLRAFEEQDRAGVRAELVPRALSLVGDALELMDRVLELHEGEGSTEEAGDSGRRDRLPWTRAKNFYVSIDWAVGAAGRSADVADLAFMARMELRATVEALEGVGPQADRWRLLALCDSCLRGLRKAASAVERGLAGHAGFEPRLEFVTELHLGRVIRAYYARFRREIEGGGPPGPETVHRRLLSAAASIAKLIGRDFYGDLRVDDRAHLRSLQERLRHWLRGEDGLDPESGVRLWQDLQGFAVLLFQINRRSELIEHDRALVSAALGELTAGPSLPDELPLELFRRLDRLRGRSDRIDQLLAEPADRASGPWVAELQRLRESLGFGTAGGGRDGSKRSPGIIDW